ncbi:LuxR C-terminal-related transcriptional regulator [Actinacidiphila acididurans]|uniref:AAA family ATPase n=1 Tax=Actinacidiphila acididurans TaxID=2784346 RepID=A0ABS2U001_9ACTN|nr:LuxR family transcriptional regulator [Actinacidiphila acididurans]MBM9507860.1 AAA family ATPase [Actinacidiphila acididurans]
MTDRGIRPTPSADGGRQAPAPLLSWPFTGREETLTELTALLAGSGRPGLLIAGPAGVGKTRLARELLAATADPEGSRVLAAAATESAARIPFGALAHLLPATLSAVEGRPNLLRFLADALLADPGSAGGAGNAKSAANPAQTLFVDDAHLLDDGSAALVLHMAVRGGTRLILTACSGVPVPDAIEALVRGGYAARVDLPPLGPDSVGRLLESVLGGQVQTATVRRLWQYSGGNVLWLQQLVDAGLASGTLAPVADVWCWPGPFRLGTHLSDLVGQRIGRLSPAVRHAAELLALGEPLGVAVLEHLAGAAIVDELDLRGLIVSEDDGRRVQVRLAHPLYGEVLRQRMPPHRRRRYCRDLAAAIQRTGMRRREDLARVGNWRLAAGDLTDPRFLVAAAEHAIAMTDFTLAARLAEAAREAGGGAAARRTLALALGHSGDGAQAEQVHHSIQPAPTADDDQVMSVVLRAATMYISLDRPADALDLLHRTEETTTDEAARAEVAAFQAVLLAAQADWPAYTQAVTRARQHTAPNPRTTVRLLYAACIDHFCHGRTGAATQAIETALTIVPGADDLPMMRIGLLGWLANVQAFSGPLDAAEATAAALYQQGADSGWAANEGSAQFYLGRIAVRRGRLRSARRHMREAAATLRDDTTWFPKALILGEWATVEAMTGNAAAAQRLLDQAHLARVESYRVFHIPVFQAARPWILAARGRVRDAARQAMRAADDARSEQALLWEAELLHLPVRLGQSAPVARRLAELAAVTDAPHITVYARHAAALAARDASATEQASAAFDTAGMRLHAAEAAAHAARLWVRDGAAAAAQQAADRCRQLARHCEGVMTPAVLACWTPGLTDRERDIARLAAAGTSSRHIADQLGITVRTVDNHLYRIYRKTGVASRKELGKVLAIDLTEAAD